MWNDLKNIKRRKKSGPMEKSSMAGDIKQAMKNLTGWGDAYKDMELTGYCCIILMPFEKIMRDSDY